MTNPAKNNLPAVAMIGFGEAARAFAEGWRGSGLIMSVFDIKIKNPDTSKEMREAFKKFGVLGTDTAEAAAADADVIFSFVTADKALEAARSAAPHLAAGALYLDCNSCAPDTKRKAAREVEAAGGRYVDVAVMSPVHPKLNKTPLNISGPHTDALMDFAKPLGFEITVLEGGIGIASSTKMIRSIMMKGLEALMAECVLSARKAGVDDLVLASLDKTYPGFDFPAKANYMLERMMVHGKRRAAEMREVALTIEQLDLSNRMTQQTVDWQQIIGDLELDPDHDLEAQDYGPRCDAILARIGHSEEEPGNA